MSAPTVQQLSMPHKFPRGTVLVNEIFLLMISSCGVVRFTLMVQEWFHFVEQEKQKRQQLALEVDQLTQESTEIREWAFEQVSAVLRSAPAHSQHLNCSTDA